MLSNRIQRNYNELIAQNKINNIRCFKSSRLFRVAYIKLKKKSIFKYVLRFPRSLQVNRSSRQDLVFDFE